MRTARRSYTYIFLLWSAIAIGAAVAIAAGYVGFGSLGEAWPPRLQAFGAGALLAMAAETMIPEADLEVVAMASTNRSHRRTPHLIVRRTFSRRDQ